MERGHDLGRVAERDVNEMPPLQTDTQREFEKQITLNSPSDGSSNRVQGRTRILRAAEVLLSLAGRRSTNDIDPLEEGPGIENFQEALRMFPPFRDDDGYTFGAVELRCPDCDAVFSAAAELEQHYLTKYCPGSAVAVYVMTRDRLITKGYRMEKRLVSLDCRPLRLFCGNCEKPFSIDETEKIYRRKSTPCFVGCKNCGEKCNISYEPVLNDPRDSGSFRDIPMDPARNVPTRSPSVTPRSVRASKAPLTQSSGGEQSLAKKARKLRDSWSFRKLSQSDEDELVAISFAGLYDLERVHAPNGVFQSLQGNAARSGHPVGFHASAPGGMPVADTKKSALTLCEEEHESPTDTSVGSPGGAIVEDEPSREPSISKGSKRLSIFQRLFGRKTPKGLSRDKSTSNRGKKLIKRVNTVRFSFVSKDEKDESGKSSPSSTGGLDSEQAREALRSKENLSAREKLNPTPVQDAEYVALLRSSQNVFVHMQYTSGAAIVHDASGRQRILKMDEVAQLFSQLKNELSAANTWSRTLTTRMRAESALNQGNLRAAVVEYHDALQMLQDTAGLDVDKLSRADILHALGQAYRGLDMPAESEACFLESLGLYKRSLGRDHPKNFEVLHDLGTLCEKDGYATEAAALYERSFAGRMKTLGHNAPETLSSMQDLASLKVLLGDLESALLLLEKAVPALDTVFGLQNGTTLSAMNKLSLLYQKLGLDKESRAISGRTIPHCKTFFGIDNPVTRDAVMRYLHSSDNFDFPTDIKDIIEQYRRSRDPEALKVIHRLGRSYMDAGLNRDAADLFEGLVDDFLVVKGPEAPETFDSLSALCVSREHLDSIEKSIHAYKQLVYMACNTPQDHHARKRIAYAEKRITELNRRREILAAERREWGLNEPGPCRNCGSSTPILCNSCKITRFCGEPCHKQAIDAHVPSCIPSVSLRESKSLAVKPRCPPATQDQALLSIQRSDTTDINVLASYTFYLDPRNFTTFRMKLSSTVNTIILFSLDSDIQYATLDSVPGHLAGDPLSSPSLTTPKTPAAAATTRTTTTAPPPPPPNTITVNGTNNITPNQQHLEWLKPSGQDSISFCPSESSPSQSRYLLVTPGGSMLKSVIDKRVQVRGGGGDRQRFHSLDTPSMELIEYAQGLLLTGYLGEAFMYVIEWESKS